MEYECRECILDLHITYRFKITVDDIFSIQKSKALDQWEGETTQKAQTESCVIVLLDQFVKIHPGWDMCEYVFIE